MATRTTKPAVPKRLTIYDEIKANGHLYTPARSAAWMDRNVRSFALQRGLGPMRLLGDGVAKNQSKLPMIGGLYFCFYSPRFKDQLPYWDSFPLMLPFSIDKTHIKSINLHYVHPRVRITLLAKLEATLNSSRLNSRTRMHVSWQILKAFAGLPLIAPAVKSYLISHVKSNFLRVDAQDWAQAVYLPVERFHKASNNIVWADSMKQTKSLI